MIEEYCEVFTTERLFPYRTGTKQEGEGYNHMLLLLPYVSFHFHSHFHVQEGLKIEYYQLS